MMISNPVYTPLINTIPDDTMLFCMLDPNTEIAQKVIVENYVNFYAKRHPYVGDVIFVKKEDKSELETFGIVSVVLNFVISLAFLPYVTVAAVLIDVNGGGSELYRQIFYFIPAVSAFCIAASVALRRRGRNVKSLIAQLIGPAAFVVYLIVFSVVGLM
jgi:hypothetical protein